MSLLTTPRSAARAGSRPPSKALRLKAMLPEATAGQLIVRLTPRRKPLEASGLDPINPTPLGSVQLHDRTGAEHYRRVPADEGRHVRGRNVRIGLAQNNARATRVSSLAQAAAPDSK